MPKKPKGAKWAKPVVVIDKARYQADGVGLLKPGYQQVFVLPSEGGTARQLTSGNFNHGRGLEWAKDSKSLVLEDCNCPGKAGTEMPASKINHGQEPAS